MRTIACLVLTASFVGSSCSSGDAKAPAGGALVLSQSTSVTAETETILDVTPGANARLIVALGDRIGDLDLTPAAPNAKQGEALVGFAPVKANESVRVRVRARPWSGADVIESFIVPFGGAPAVAALAAATPELAKGKMISVQVDIISRTSTQSTIHNLVIAAGEAPGASTRFDVGNVIAFGAPVRVQDWVMAGGDGYTPALHQTGATLRASSPAGDAAIEELKAAAWTLWIQLEPDA